MQVPQKIKTELPYDPASPLLSVHPENRYVHPRVHSGTIYNSQVREATQAPTNR